MPLKRDPENDCFVGYDECHYDTEWEAYSIGTLGMCGCGTPEEAYNFLHAVLMICDRRGCHDNPPTRDWIAIESEIAKLVAAQPELVAHVLMHLLTAKDVITHGGSVGGSWLTELGEELVDAGPAPLDPSPPA